MDGLPSTEYTPIQIPPQYQHGLAELRRLDDASAQELLLALRESPPVLSTEGFTSRLISRVNRISASEVSEMTLALLSLYSLRTQLGVSSSEVAELIVRAMEESNLEELRVPNGERERFRKRLNEFLSVDSIEIAGKAGNLLFDNEHVLREARIITDIRPVFDLDPEEPPKSAIIVHQLRVTYQEGGVTKNIYFALDEADIDMLQRLFERADKKAESLRSVLKTAQITHISPG